MDIQQQWEALCRAYESKDWDELEALLPQVKASLDAGRPPVISDQVSEGFNLAMARAGISFIYSHFSRTTEWPTVEPDTDSESRFGE